MILMFGLVAITGAISLMAYLMLGRSAVAGVEGDWTHAPTISLIKTPKERGEQGETSALYKRASELTRRITPSAYAGKLQHKLDLAGNPRDWGADRVLAFKGFGLVLGAILGFMIGIKHGVGLTFVATLGLAAFGFFVPDLYVRILGEKRQVEIQKGLPDVMDMLTVCVEAGLGFDAALARVARNLQGSMPQECARVLQEMQFGKSRADALRALVERTTVAELRTFVSAMIQAGELGISVGGVLRDQAAEMRIKRRQRAEEKAQKLQVKILGPLIVCLLPCIFVVVIGPAAIQMMHFFKSTHH
jgi:tight adherence protein C